MQNIIISVIGTISLVTIAIYDFLCICLIIKKEKLAEFVWKNIFPNRTYNETKLFRLFRPLALQVSMVCFILSGGVLVNLPLFSLLVTASMPLTIGVIFRNFSHK